MNVMIVDDEMIAIEAILARTPFEKYGIAEVFKANSMQQAMDIIVEKKVDIILCDIEMPSGSGMELIEWINANQPEIVKLILSCHNEFEFAQQAMELSCLLYILKPATPDVMDKALAKAVETVVQGALDTKLKHLGEVYVQKLTDTTEQDKDIAEMVKNYIVEHIQEELIVERLAQMLYVSQNHLARCFKKKYGKTMTEYIEDYRLSLAEKLLQSTNLTVTMISAKVGYPNYTYFTKQFKKHRGHTPSLYRSLYTRREV